jgi:hypothetical protein
VILEIGPASPTDMYVSIVVAPGQGFCGFCILDGYSVISISRMPRRRLEIAPTLGRDRSFALHPFHNVLGDRDQLGALVPHLDFGSRPPFLVVGFGDFVGDLDCVAD